MLLITASFFKTRPTAWHARPLARPTQLATLGPPAGAKFELIRGAPEERFKRIVLQDTCLKVQGRVAVSFFRRLGVEL